MTAGPGAWPTLLEIDLGAIVANWRALRRGPTAAVVKADAYGLGARPVAPALHAAGCRHFFTAHPGEALAMRDLVPGAMLAVLNGLWPGLEPDFAATTSPRCWARWTRSTAGRPGPHARPRAAGASCTSTPG